jgi:hypothetical protein
LSDQERLARAEAALGVRFRTPETLREALTHRSFVREQAGEAPRSNERLEFLGDALLGFLVADTLFERFPDAPEGDLTDWRVALIRTDTLARWARQRELGPLLYLERGARPGELSDRVLGNAFEAILAAIYCDAGLDAARAFLAEHLPDVPPLEPVLRTTYTRVTLAGPAERVTIDSDLAYDEAAGLRPEWVLVETKSPRGHGIADDVLRDLYVRGKYRDVILPMTVLRRLDAVLEPTKPAVLDMKAALDR